MGNGIADGTTLLQVKKKPSRNRVGPSTSNRGRKVVRIEVDAGNIDSAMVDVFGLCNDGSIWRRGIGTGGYPGPIDDQWERIPLDGMEDIDPEQAFTVVIASSHQFAGARFTP